MLADARGRFVDAGVALRRLSRTFFQAPSHVATRAGITLLRLGRPEPLEQRQLVHAIGERAGVVRRDAAAHRVSDERHARAPDLRDDLVQIGEVIGEVVVAAGADPVAVAVAAHVGRDDVEAGRERGLDHRLPAPRGVEKAVDEHDRMVAVAPLEQW